jgi:Transposase IS116/IS110/IS902 family
VPIADLFGVGGRRLLARLELPEPWAADTAAALQLIDQLDRDIGECERALRRMGADHRYVSLLMTTPGIGWVLGYTIAAEIGDITRFASPTKPAGAPRPGSVATAAPRSPKSISPPVRGDLDMLTTDKPFAPAGAAESLAS